LNRAFIAWKGVTTRNSKAARRSWCESREGNRIRESRGSAIVRALRFKRTDRGEESSGIDPTSDSTNEGRTGNGWVVARLGGTDRRQLAPLRENKLRGTRTGSTPTRKDAEMTTTQAKRDPQAQTSAVVCRARATTQEPTPVIANERRGIRASDIKSGGLRDAS